jgi:hypothetical protein
MPDEDEDEMCVIDDEDGDTSTDADECSRKKCGHPRSSHEDGLGGCRDCPRCPRFLAD